MKKEIESIIQNLENVMNGEPWYGRSVKELLAEVDGAKAGLKPNGQGHSLLDLIYHINTWAEFTLASMEKSLSDPSSIEKLDWRTIDPARHNWQKGVAELDSLNQKILQLLKTKDDDFLSENVPHRKFDFCFLLNGYIQHNIYHTGQIAYVSKFLV